MENPFRKGLFHESIFDGKLKNFSIARTGRASRPTRTVRDDREQIVVLQMDEHVEFGLVSERLR